MQLHKGGKTTGEVVWETAHLLDKSHPFWRRPLGKFQGGGYCQSSPVLFFECYKWRKTKKKRNHGREACNKGTLDIHEYIELPDSSKDLRLTGNIQEYHTG